MKEAYRSKSVADFAVERSPGPSRCSHPAAHRERSAANLNATGVLLT